jgi:4-alpha-glucanotransferase
MVLKEKFQGQPWYEWKRAIALRDKRELASLQHVLQQRIYYYQFEQYLFYLQWNKLQRYAQNLGIRIFGDIPIYVSLDSADVWSNQDIFQLDNSSGLPTHVAGVPPDYFSDTGQKWGNPLYRWNSGDTAIDRRLHQWWIARFRSVFQIFDMARIDHFRGFESYWSIPTDHSSALKGSWRKGPGKDFFDTIFNELGPLNIIAEDLGEITDAVIALRDDLDFPGMKVLQFAFDNNPDNAFLPHNYDSPNCIVYTGTHDNDTSLGWFLGNRIDDDTRRRVKQQANREMGDHQPIHHDLIYLAMSSIAAIAIIPLQDVLGFGSDCRMNTPGTASGNWEWRCGEEFLTEDVAEWLRNLTILFRRNQLPPSSV